LLLLLLLLLEKAKDFRLKLHTLLLQLKALSSRCRSISSR
jgi:hypothetical protein